MKSTHASGRVSIYIPTFNRLELLKRALLSATNQTVPALEILVVDDGSDDGTIEYVQELSEREPRVRLLRKNGMPRGASASRNLAINSAKGDFVTGLDDDDWFLPRRLELLLKAYDGRHAAVCSNYVVLSKAGRRRTSCVGRSISANTLLHRNAVGNQVLAERARVLEIGGFDEGLSSSQDLDLWIRLARKFGAIKRISASLYVIDTTHEKERISTSPGRLRGDEQLLAKYASSMTEAQISFRRRRLDGTSGMQSFDLSGLALLLERVRTKLWLG